MTWHGLSPVLREQSFRSYAGVSVGEWPCLVIVATARALSGFTSRAMVILSFRLP
jgi:hypothetical protein